MASWLRDAVSAALASARKVSRPSGVLRLLAGLLLGVEELALGAAGGVQLGVERQYALVGLVEFLAVERGQPFLLVEALQQQGRVLVGAEEGLGQRRRVVGSGLGGGEVRVLGAGGRRVPRGLPVVRATLHRIHLDAEARPRRVTGSRPRGPATHHPW